MYNQKKDIIEVIQPYNKKPKIEYVKNNGSNSVCESADPFDCFTGDELVELELVATQAENKQNYNKVPFGKKPIQLAQLSNIFFI